jgi:hypothetical protein
LVKYNDSRNAANQGTFYAMATHFFTVLKRLFAQSDNTDNEQKVKALCKELPTTYGNAYNTITYLNWAVYNWFYRNEKTITEYLSDNGYETNSCAVCDFTGEATFYFSTAYGLEKPVCMFCLPVDETDYEKKDEDYVEEEEVSETESSEAESSEAESSEAEDDEVSDEDDGVEGAESLDDDSDYVPSEDEEESDSDEEEDGVEGAEPLDEEESEDDSDASSNYTEETDLEDSEAEEEESETDASETEKTFGCEGCSYEFRAGFKHGWRRAMKAMRNYAIAQRANEPEAPHCEICNVSHENLLKCAGQCGGLVRYCSERCQRDDWQEHKVVCRR